MTVLVDAAIWEWRGERWAHLASDESAAELHRFANRVGLPRLAYQGDHYDVPERLRSRAVVLGAREVRGRELVQALRVSGLRRRGGLPRWEVVDEPIIVDDRDGVDLVAALDAHGASRERAYYRRPEEYGVWITGRMGDLERLGERVTELWLTSRNGSAGVEVIAARHSDRAR